MKSQFSLKIISNYAKSLFDVACKYNKVDLIHDQIISASDFFNANYNRIRVSGISMCNLILSSKFDALVKNFFYILSKNNRINLLSDIISQYKILVDEYNGTKIAEITFAIKPKKQELQKLTDLISDKMSCKVIPKVNIDSNLLWGAVIDIENTRFHGSYRSMINKMKQKKDKFIGIVSESVMVSVFQ